MQRKFLILAVAEQALMRKLIDADVDGVIIRLNQKYLIGEKREQ